MSLEENKAFVDRMTEEFWNKGNLAVVDEFYAADYVGHDPNGTTDLGSSATGVCIYNAPDNTIGGTTAAASNVISGNDDSGVIIHGAGATGNQV